MKRSVKTIVAGRILLPLALLIGCSIRINAMSLLYFLLLLALPFIPAPTTKHVSWLTIRHTQCVMGAALFASFSLFVFHVCLIATGYGRNFVDCHLYEKIARQFGFQRWDHAYSNQIIRQVCPEILVTCISIFTYRMYKKKSRIQKYTLTAGLFSAATFSFVCGEKTLWGADTQPPTFGKKQQAQQHHLGKITAPAKTLSEHLVRVLKRLGASSIWPKWKKAIFALIVCGSGIAHPNLMSFFYFVVFLTLANLWILNISLGPIYRNRLVKLLAALAGLHLFILYFYQFDFVQEHIHWRSIGARLLGLTAIYITDCRDVRALSINPDYRFSYILHIIMLSIMYRNCVEEMCDDHRSSFELVVKETDERVPKGSIIQAEIRQSVLIRRSLGSDEKSSWLRQLFKDRSRNVNDKEEESREKEEDGVKNRANVEDMEATTMEKQEAEEENASRKLADSGQSRTNRALSIFEFKKKIHVKADTAKRLKQAVRQYSYVGCLVVMMTWSVTYHSWLTFALLLLSCVIWMVPNPRQFCLRITPYLVCYAEVLLIFQYIYGLDLTESELPSETAPVLHQIGFVKPDVYPAWVHLFIKVCYTFAFWITFKAYLNERRRQAGGIDAKESIDVEAGQPTVALATSEPDGELIDFELPATKDEVEAKEMSAEDAKRSEATEIDELGRGSEERDIKILVPEEAQGLRGKARTKLLAPVTKLAQQKTLLAKLVPWFHRKITQLWIVICCIVLLYISLRQPVVAYTIVYMGLLQTFINFFLISFRLWRKFLKYFWTVMIVYCMCVLTFIYTYQFRKFPEMWHYGTGWSYDVLESLGLEQYNSGELLMKLMTPISFLICTIVQLKFFHKQLIDKTARLEEELAAAEEQDLLKSACSSKIEKVPSTASIAELEETSDLDDQNTSATSDANVQIDSQSGSKTENVGTEESKATAPDGKIEVDVAYLLRSGCRRVLSFLHKNRLQIAELVWRFLEIHLFKIIAFQMLAISIQEVSAIHLLYPVFVVVTLPLEKSRRLVYKIAGVWTSIIILFKMVFQMKFVKPADAFVNCSSVPGVPGAIYRHPFPFPEFRTVDTAAWAGFQKSDIGVYLRPYFLLIGLLLLQELVRMRQTLRRAIKKTKAPPCGVLFDHITRREADDSLLHCLMYFINYFFFKFGLEACFVMTVMTIGLRCDFVSVLYGLWLVVLLNQHRRRTRRLWRFYVIFLAILLPLQYFSCIGIPPSICSSYPWSFINQNMLEWLYLPDFGVPPNAVKLGADFMQFLLACCQMRVFEIECSPDAYYFPGGDNSEIVEPVKVVSFKLGLQGALQACRALEECNASARKSEYEEPVADFISYPKSYLDLFKIILFQHLYWGTLIVVFVAGVSRVTLFAFGYVLAGFVFLWVGNELFLKPLPFGLRMWNILILYNAFVILIKTSLQVIGCVFLDDLYKRYCWGLQLFGIACLKSRFDPAKVVDERILADCKVPTTEAGIIFDGICFCFLLLQRRIIMSRYFVHVVAEFRAQHFFANRGAELIHKIRSKQILERQMRERELVMKIKQKMEKIKEAQEKMTAGDSGQEGSSKQAERYRASIDVDDEANDAAWDLELQNEQELVPENEEDRRKGLGPLQLLNVAFKKGDIKAAVEDAKEMEAQEEELKKQMAADFGKADKKAIKEALRKRVSTRVLPDFEEESFDPDRISEDVIEAIYRKRSEVNVSMDEESRASHEDDVEEEIGSLLAEETALSSLSSSPEPEQKLSTLLAKTYLVSRILALWSAIVEFLNNTITFLKLFLNGVLESAIAWLLKISREYRYVAHALTEEKKSFKSEKKWADLNRGPSLLTTSSYRKFRNRGRGTSVLEKRKRRGLSFYDRKLAEEEAKKFNKDRNVFVRLFASTYYVLLSRSELFCYLMMVLAHMASASLVTMPLPVMAFVWGTLSVPKPTRRFWVAVITYTEAVVIIKYLFQFGFFPWNRGVPPPHPFFPPRILGIERRERYVAWDLALLMMLFFHRSNQKTLGLWKERQETDAESMSSQHSGSRGGGSRRSSAMGGSVSFHQKTLQLVVPPSIPEESFSKRAASEEELEGEDKKGPNGEGDTRSRLKRVKKKYQKMKERWKKVKIKRWMRIRAAQIVSFFKTLVNPRFRCSIDVYALMFLCDFICFVIVIFGYWAFGTETGAGIASYFEENKIPGPFLAMLVVQFILIIIDRALFLRKHLLGKVVYQIGLVLFVHIWMFFILPAVTDRQFINNTPAKLWYFVKCIYFCLSAWQIRSGYPTRVLGNMLTKQYNYLNMLLFKGFMAIPFLFELRALMDWIWTDTSMSLSDWLKLEDIYANIYMIKCERKIEEDYPTPRGVKRRPLLKYGWGGILLFLMILIIWFPLVLFSLANTVGIRSLPLEVTVKLTLGAYPVAPLYQGRVTEDTRATLTDDEYEDLQYEYRHSKVATAYMSDYSSLDVIRVTFAGNSDGVWAISPAARQDLIGELNSSKTISLKFEWQFLRPPDNFGQSNSVSDVNVITLSPDSETRTDFIKLLTNSGGFNSVNVSHLYPPYVKVPGKGKAAPLKAMLFDKAKGDIITAFVNTTLSLLRMEKQEYWKISAITAGMDDIVEANDYLQMTGFVDKVFPATFNWIAGGGIIGLYLGLVLVAGKFIRSQVTGAMSRIMFEELPNVDRILQLCLDIFLVRESGELALEEDLFAKLIFIYRSPATLIKWTKLKKM